MSYARQVLESMVRGLVDGRIDTVQLVSFLFGLTSGRREKYRRVILKTARECRSRRGRIRLYEAYVQSELGQSS